MIDTDDVARDLVRRQHLGPGLFRLEEVENVVLILVRVAGDHVVSQMGTLPAKRGVGDVVGDLDRLFLLVRVEDVRREVARVTVIHLPKSLAGALGELQSAGPDATAGWKVLAFQSRSVVQDRRKRLLGSFQHSPMLFTRWAPNGGTEETSHVQGIGSDRLGVVGDHPSIGVVDPMELVRRSAHELAALVRRQRLGELAYRLSRHEAEVAGGAVGFGRGHHSITQLSLIHI